MQYLKQGKYMSLIAAWLCAFALLLPSPAYSICGDADGSGGMSIGDIVFMLDYILGGPPPADYDNAEADGRRGVTVSDGAYLMSCMFGGCPPLTTCGSIVSPISPQPDSSYRFNYHWQIPADLDHFTVHCYLQSQSPVAATQLPLRFLVDGAPCSIDSVEQIGGAVLKYFTLCDDSTTLVDVRVSLLTGIEGYFLKVHLAIPYSTTERELEVQYVTYVPPQAPPEHQYEVSPMAVTYPGTGAQPILTRICCDTGGDANQDGTVTIADAVYIINYTFGGGPGPNGCISETDADGSGAVSIGDAVYIINYIFGGGPAPTCVS